MLLVHESGEGCLMMRRATANCTDVFGRSRRQCKEYNEDDDWKGEESVIWRSMRWTHSYTSFIKTMYVF